MTILQIATASNESDVEQKVIFPLLTSPGLLAIPQDAVKTKAYLAPTQLDKSAGRKIGYYPDYSVWLLGMPVLIVEAKDPTVPSETGFREASLYARHLNSRYQTNLNPCRFILATNGKTLLAGYWDQDVPALQFSVPDIGIGTTAAERLIAFCGVAALATHSNNYFKQVKIQPGTRPYSLLGGQALLNAKFPLNTFATDLSPVLRRYFSSSTEEQNREIAERAYVSSAETTEYDRILEAILKDRLSPRRDTIVQPIYTSKNEEPVLTKALRDYSHGPHNSGQLQIIQGAVGSGKSLFARRYRDLLEPAELKSENYWSFINFNGSPASLKGAEGWLCETFIKGFERENASIDLYSGDVLRGIFSKRIQQRRSYYESLRSISEAEEIRARAKDIVDWQSDPIAFSEGIAQYIVGIKAKNLVVVMDNVDKLELQNQLDAFQLALWFMERSKGFVILQMRDETYERYKNRPPLDTFRAGIAFHISPPRFIDVVKRRLELGIEYLSQNANEKQEFVLDNGVRVILPKGELGNFLKALYLLLFGKRGNVSRVLEAIAGRDVRKALEMFVSIVTSGHLSTSAITSHVRGEGAIPLNEHHILRILMRTDYRFFSNNNSNVTNILHYENTWTRPDNFLLPEILYFLSMNRKIRGDIGLEGYFSVAHVCDVIERIGYDRTDIWRAVTYLLGRQLIIADNFNVREVGFDDSVKIQASGFIHLRVLCERIEYLFGIIPVVPIADEKVANGLADYINREKQRGDISAKQKTMAVEILQKFLKYELTRLREPNPFFIASSSGAVYVLHQMDNAINRYYRLTADSTPEQNELDLS